MEKKVLKHGRQDLPPGHGLGGRLTRSPLLGLRHAMCSPAPRERESSEDDSPRSPITLDRPAKKGGGFPSIKVEKCDALPPVRHSSAKSDTGRRTPVSPVSTEGVNNLYVPSPVHQRRGQDGRVVVVTNNLEGMKSFSKSEGDLEEALNACSIQSPGEVRNKRLDASFRPQKKTRPTVHLTSGYVKEKIKSPDVGKSSPKRSIRLVPLKDGIRTRSHSDLSAK